MSKPDNPLIHAMLNTDFYPHPVKAIKLIETHISWIFLTGDYVYKVKKPVDFGFLDFSTLERRKYFCEEELRLNRRLAPDIYLDVLAITGTNSKLRLNGEDQPVEYTVLMKEFEQECLLDRQLKNHTIDLGHIESLAETIAAFHQKIAVAEDASPFGASEQLLQPVEENFTVLQQLLEQGEDKNKIESIRQRCLTLHEQLSSVFSQRKQHGFIRECHGDMHLGNIALIDNRMTLFDGIEFNESFRWIDVMSDLAFLIMDLQDHDRSQFAYHVLNRYLETTGDYSGLSVLRFYQLYRAMVRAKVAVLRMAQQQRSSNDYKNSLHSLRSYLSLAESYLQPQQVRLFITHGISGSGKSWLAQQLADRLGAIRVRSDVERKRLYDLNAKDSSQAAEIFIYDQDSTEKTYQRLSQLAATIIQAGYSAIVDATFLDTRQRQKFRELAASLDTGFHIFSCYADRDILVQRIRHRQTKNQDASEADIAIMEKQLFNYQPLTQTEKEQTLEVDTSQVIDIDEIVYRLNPAAK